MTTDLPILGKPDGPFVIVPILEMDGFIDHRHHFHEITYFSSGTGTLRINGREHPIRSPQLHFIAPAPAWHGFRAAKSIRTSSMAIYPNFMGAEGSGADLFAMLAGLCDPGEPLIDLKQPAMARVEELIAIMCEEYRLQLPGHMLRIGACVQEIVVLALRERQGVHIHPSVARHQAASSGSDTPPTPTFVLERNPRISLAIQRMKDTLPRPITNADLAAVADMEQKYFIRLFTSEVGMSPQRYYLRLRLESAANYLINTDLSILELSHLFGFRHRSHFQLVFRDYFKTTPSLYRYLHRRGE